MVCKVKPHVGKHNSDGNSVIMHVDRTGKIWTADKIAGLVLAKVIKDAVAMSGIRLDRVSNGDKNNERMRGAR